MAPYVGVAAMSVYTDLDYFNRSLLEAVALLHRLKKPARLNNEQLQIFQAQIQEVRALVSQQIIEEQNEVELRQAAHFHQKRLKWEKRL
jgi:hypothetical protein